MRHKKMKKLGFVVIALLSCMYLITSPTGYVKADTTELQVTVANPAQPSEIKIFDDGGWTEAADLSPQDEMFINFTITDQDTLAELDWIRIIIYNDVEALWDDSPNDTSLAQFFWVETTDTWNLTDDGSSTWAINTGSCDDPGTDSGLTTYEFTLVFTPGKVAMEATADDWNVNVTAMDDDTLEKFNTTITTAAWTGLCAWYGELSITQGSTYGNYTTAEAGGSNVSIYNTNEGANTYLIMQVIANGVYDIQGSVSDWAGPEAIDVDATPIEWINDDDSWDDGFTQEIDTDTVTYYDGSTLGYDNTLEAGVDSNAYFRFAVPAGKPGGSYTQTLTLTVINDP